MKKVTEKEIVPKKIVPKNIKSEIDEEFERRVFALVMTFIKEQIEGQVWDVISRQIWWDIMERSQWGIIDKINLR